jgi:hypothetical protein
LYIEEAGLAPDAGLRGRSTEILGFVSTIYLLEPKMSKRLLISAAAFIALASTYAQAADEQFCKDYARTAVAQFHEAEEHDRCDAFRRRDPARWQPDFRAHYDWCRNVHRDDANIERSERSRALEHCVRHDR